MTYTVGSMCLDCLHFGEVNFLRQFYISLDEQIIKCQSNKCMYPYLKRSDLKTSLNADIFPPSPPPDVGAKNLIKPYICNNYDNIFSLDDFVNIQAVQIEISSKSQQNTEEIINYDFTNLLSDHTPTAKEEPKPLQSTLNSSNTIADKTNEDQSIPKARITKCFANVKTASMPKDASTKIVKQKAKKNKPMLIVERKTRKYMRPLDYIQHLLKKTD